MIDSIHQKLQDINIRTDKNIPQRAYIHVLRNMERDISIIEREKNEVISKIQTVKNIILDNEEDDDLIDDIDEGF